MVDDYLTDRDQWEAVKTWLKENGLAIVGGIALGIGALWGWNFWQDYQTRQGQEAAARYTDVLAALDRNDRERALELTKQLHEEYGRTPYPDQADLALARVYVESAELDEAAKRLRSVMENSKDEELRQIARVRLARVLLGQGKYDEALATLDAGKPGAFAAQYAEVRGDILYAKGDKAGALAEYRRARELATEPGMVDLGLLQLKINDLASAEESAAPSAAGDEPEAQTEPASQDPDA